MKDKETEFMLCPYCKLTTKLIDGKCSNCGTPLFRCSYDINQEVEVLEDRQDG